MVEDADHPEETAWAEESSLRCECARRAMRPCRWCQDPANDPARQAAIIRSPDPHFYERTAHLSASDLWFDEGKDVS